MSNMFNRLVEFLNKDNWKYEIVKDGTVVRLGFSGKHGKYECIGSTRDEKGQLVFYSIVQANVPEDKRSTVAEYLTRANYGLSIGNFEMDMKDGEIRFKTSIRCSDAAFDDEIIKNVIYINLMTIDDYFPGLMRVLYANVTPTDAIAEIEKNEAKAEESKTTPPTV